MTRRMLIALLALGGVFLAAYLTLFHYGYVGSLACGTGGCEKVQGSNWAKFLGQPVALWGVGYYLSVFAVAMAGSMGALAEKRWPSVALVALNGWGVIFSGYLTWLEIVKIDAICRYCVGSATVVVVLFVLSWFDLRAQPAATASPAGQG
jgi:uncharacterized membrane protein